MEKIGKYHLLRKLGEGSTGAVYLSFDPFADRDVAIKIAYPKALKDPESGHLYRKIFETEACLAGKLNHPHIVAIHDAVVEEDLTYIVMEFVEGGTLEKYCAFDNLLPFERVVDIIFKCTRALDFAKQGGIIHRDLKPANILLIGEDEQVKISDFGSAIVAGSGIKPIEGLGSPAYMSPEQAQHLKLDFRTDIYSMGVVMFQLLTGRVPFEGKKYKEVLQQVVNNDVPPPSKFRLDVPEAIDAIVLKATARNRDHRYLGWEEFSAALQNALRPAESAPKAVAREWGDATDSEKFEFLKGLPFFAEFRESELWEVLKIGQWQKFPAEITIMREGEEDGDFFCFIAAGEVKISRHGKTITLLGSGECIGEMAYLGKTNKTRAADVTACEDVQLMTIRTADLEAASESCRHHFSRAFLALLVDRLALANQRLIGA